jgi:hypothetical protein
MESRRSYTIEEVRTIFRVMVDRLRNSAESLPDMARFAVVSISHAKIPSTRGPVGGNAARQIRTLK